MMLGQIYEQQENLKDAVKVYSKAASNEKLPENQRRSFSSRINQIQGK
jgi:cytochrome c-type biogenesis protein CcmH/NrfG